jgi:hypothetical protein
VTVDVMIVSHLAAVEGTLADTTFEDYLGVAARLRASAPVFVERMVASTGAPVIEALYRQLAASGWSPHRLSRLHDLLSTSWRRAARYGWAGSNPLREVQRPRIPVAEVNPPDTADVAALLAVAPDAFRLYLRLAAAN